MAVPQLISVEKLSAAKLVRREKFFLHFTHAQLENLKKSLTSKWPNDRIPSGFMQLHVVQNPDGAIGDFRCTKRGCSPKSESVKGGFTFFCPEEIIPPIGPLPDPFPGPIPGPFPGTQPEPCKLIVGKDGSLSCSGTCLRRIIRPRTVKSTKLPRVLSLACKLYGKATQCGIIAFCACPVPKKRPVIRPPR